MESYGIIWYTHGIPLYHDCWCKIDVFDSAVSCTAVFFPTLSGVDLSQQRKRLQGHRDVLERMESHKELVREDGTVVRFLVLILHIHDSMLYIPIIYGIIQNDIALYEVTIWLMMVNT